jgi:histone H3
MPRATRKTEPAATVVTTEGVKKPRRWHPGTVARRRVVQQQRSTSNNIPKSTLERVIRATVADVAETIGFPTGVRLTADAAAMIQVFAEAFVTDAYGQALKFTVGGKRRRLLGRDVELYLGTLPAGHPLTSDRLSAPAPTSVPVATATATATPAPAPAPDDDEETVSSDEDDDLFD